MTDASPTASPTSSPTSGPTSRIVHLSCFRWNSHLPQGHVETLKDALAGLPGLIPELVDYSFGENVGAETNADFGVCAVVESMADFAAYQEHPEHQRVLTELIVPFLNDRTAIQFGHSDMR